MMISSYTLRFGGKLIITCGVVLFIVLLLPTAPVNESQSISHREISASRDIKEIVVISQARSGSSLTGELLTTLSDYTYYNFEPLYKLGLQNRSEEYRNSKVLPLLTDNFNCKIDTLLVGKRRWALKHTVGKFQSGGTSIYDAKKEQDPVNWLRDICEQSVFKVVKIIRTSIWLSVEEHAELLARLMTRFPDSATVFLTRDPRAIHYSRVRRNFAGTKEHSSDEICSVVLNTFQTYKKLAAKEAFQERVFLVEYEKLARDPVNVMSHLTRVGLGMEYRNYTNSWIEKNMLSCERKQDRAYNVHDRCSREGIDSWRNSTQEMEVTNTCRTALSELKYQ